MGTATAPTAIKNIPPKTYAIGGDICHTPYSTDDTPVNTIIAAAAARMKLTVVLPCLRVPDPQFGRGVFGVLLLHENRVDQRHDQVDALA